MAITYAANMWLRAPKTTNGQEVDLQRFPRQFDGWVAEEFMLNDKIQEVLRTDQTLLRHYIGKNGKKVELFIGYFRDQKFGAQVHSPLHCLPGSGWTIIHHGKLQLPFNLPEGHANQLHIVKNDENQFVLYWFNSDGNLVKNEFDLKIRLLINAFKNRATSVYFYRLCVPFAANEEKAALQALEEFLVAASPHFNHVGRLAR